MTRTEVWKCWLANKIFVVEHWTFRGVIWCKEAPVPEWFAASLWHLNRFLRTVERRLWYGKKP